jgi:hypothetical protein
MIVWVLIIVLPSSNFRRWRRTAVLDRMWMDPVWMNTSWGNERNAIGWKKFCESSSLLVSWQVSDIIVFFGWKVLFLANGSMTRVENYHLKWTPWSCVGKRRMHNPKNPDLVFFFFFFVFAGALRRTVIFLLFPLHPTHPGILYQEFWLVLLRNMEWAQENPLSSRRNMASLLRQAMFRKV